MEVSPGRQHGVGASWENYTLKAQGWSESAWYQQLERDPGWERRRFAGHGHRGVWGYGWYRIRVNLAPKSGSLSLLVPLIDDAYAIYWDGQKLGGYGDPDRHISYQHRQRELLSIPAALAGPGEHVLAVRLWHFPLPALKIPLLPAACEKRLSWRKAAWPPGYS